MISFFIGLFIGAALGALGMGLLAANRDEDQCNACRGEQRRVIRGLEDVIHGLRSSKGALGNECNNLAFRNAGFRAR